MEGWWECGFGDIDTNQKFHGARLFVLDDAVWCFGMVCGRGFIVGSTNNMCISGG